MCDEKGTILIDTKLYKAQKFLHALYHTVN